MNKAEELANTLVNTTQIPYQWFEYGSLLLMNVSLTEDPNHFQEYHVYKKDDETQQYYLFESITVNAMAEYELSYWLKEQERKNINEMIAITGSKPLKDTDATKFSFEAVESFKCRFNKLAASY